MTLINGDCLNEMKNLADNSIDLIFCDLPYGQTSCKWDCKIDLEEFWKQVMRIKKLNTPLFFTTTTKFGVELINSAPKKCPFRYDIVWVKSSNCGFLSAKKMPMRKHEMVYVFYEKLPFYDLSSHTHKFIKEGKKSEGDKGNECYGKFKYYNNGEKGYEPPLPVSVVKEEEDPQYNKERKIATYGNNKEIRKKNERGLTYDPPLPVSVVKEESKEGLAYKPSFNQSNNADNEYRKMGRKGGESAYDPPLPTSVVKDGSVNEEYEGLYGGLKAPEYVSNNIERNKLRRKYKKEGKSESAYDPPLPTTMLEIKSTRGKHSTEKPVALMEWVLKYYSKEGDVVLDPTMGSGSTGVACKNMNRNFIGIEMDKEIFKIAESRVNA